MSALPPPVARGLPLIPTPRHHHPTRLRSPISHAVPRHCSCTCSTRWPLSPYFLVFSVKMIHYIRLSDRLCETTPYLPPSILSPPPEHPAFPPYSQLFKPTQGRFNYVLPLPPPQNLDIPASTGTVFSSRSWCMVRDSFFPSRPCCFFALVPSNQDESTVFSFADPFGIRLSRPETRERRSAPSFPHP